MHDVKPLRLNLPNDKAKAKHSTKIDSFMTIITKRMTEYITKKQLNSRQLSLVRPLNHSSTKERKQNIDHKFVFPKYCTLSVFCGTDTITNNCYLIREDILTN